jgi:hypothetical protein
MIEKPNGRPGGHPKRPGKSSTVRGHHTTARPSIPTFKQRLEAAKTGYLSLSSHLSDELKTLILDRVCQVFPNLRIGTYSTEFEDGRDWNSHIKNFLSDVDMLIIAYDPSRVIGWGVKREMSLARHFNKLIVTFSIESGLPTLFFGYDVIREENKPKAIRLRSQKREREEVAI